MVNKQTGQQYYRAQVLQSISGLFLVCVCVRTCVRVCVKMHQLNDKHL